MRVNHVKVSEEVMSFDCPKCGSGGATVVGSYHNGWLPMSRREQRRARKAAKNKAMIAVYGWRPWSHRVTLWPVCGDVDIWADYSDELCRQTAKVEFTNHWDRMRQLRERSGFLDMSRRADETAWLRGHLAEFNRLSVSTLFDEAAP